MPSPLPEPSGPSEHETQFTTERYAARVLALVALIYALLAGLHTLQDYDLGWQLATGRWVFQHRQIFSTDVFSYTAHGAPWINPVLSPEDAKVSLGLADLYDAQGRTAQAGQARSHAMPRKN